jgi:2-C-methyl-D-erythritol 4-phosphate cytidylyltransferase
MGMVVSDKFNGDKPLCYMGNHPQSIPDSKRTEAIIVAAGRGVRLGGEIAKSMRSLGGIPLFAHAVGTFQKIPDISGIIVVVGSEDVETTRHWIQKLQFTKVVAIVPGGRERSDSVQEGLKVVAPDTKWIAIHDGARPFVSSTLILRVLLAAQTCGAAIPVIPITDTIKEVRNDEIIATIPRKQLFGAQTPQIFLRQRLLEAYQKAQEKGFHTTDDADIVQHFASGTIKIVPGEENNFKIATLEDWERAEDSWKKHSVSGENT